MTQPEDNKNPYQLALLGLLEAKNTSAEGDLHLIVAGHALIGHWEAVKKALEIVSSLHGCRKYYGIDDPLTDLIAKSPFDQKTVEMIIDKSPERLNLVTYFIHPEQPEAI